MKLRSLRTQCLMLPRIGGEQCRDRRRHFILGRSHHRRRRTRRRRIGRTDRPPDPGHIRRRSG